MNAVRTDRTGCKCGARTIVARGTPPLDYAPDPAGTWTAFHEVTGAWTVRPYQPGDVLGPLEKRHRVHECPKCIPCGDSGALLIPDADGESVSSQACLYCDTPYPAGDGSPDAERPF